MDRKYFPYDNFRVGQERMFDFIRNNLYSGIVSLVHAPTGIGKTASSLGAALEFAENKDYKIFFLTNRHEHHRIVFETIKKINEKYNTSFRAINVINKKLLCNQNLNAVDTSDFHEYCKTLRKDHMCYFYENTIKNGTLTNKAKIIIEKISLPLVESNEIKKEITDFCPYEIILNLAKKAHVIIADYYYFFNPSIRDGFLGKLGIKLNDAIIIVDEAHNLPERIRRMYDMRLTTYTLGRAIKEVKRYYPDIASILVNIGASIEAYLLKKIRKEDNQDYIPKEDLIDIIEKEISYYSLIDILYDVAEKKYLESSKSYANSIKRFLEFWEEDKDSIVRIGEIKRKQNEMSFSIRVSDIDVSSKIKEVFENVGGGILMSATLNPLKMYQDITGLSSKSRTLHLMSPFPQHNAKVYVVKGLTTKYEYRDKSMFKLYAEVISFLANNLSTNMIFFFPSYEIKDNILSHVSLRDEKIILEERKDIDKKEKDKILSIMDSHQDVVLFAVSGANFYEGVDFKGKMAEIVGIVGIPFEKPDLYTKAVIKYYDRLFNKGKEYGYVIPTLNKVIQSAGRIIRSEKEKGIILLLDDRYLFPSYFSIIRDRYSFIDVIAHEELIREIIFMKNFFNDSINETRKYEVSER